LKGLGIHILAEFYGCDAHLLNNSDYIKLVIEEATKKAGATLITSFSHNFSPYGVTGIAVIAESHLSIHTWPEYEYAAVDVFTCGESADPYAAFRYIKEKLKAKDVEIKKIVRGKIKYVVSAHNLKTSYLGKPT